MPGGNGPPVRTICRDGARGTEDQRSLVGLLHCLATVARVFVFPTLRQRRARETIEPKIDVARRVLWRAYQRGHLSEEELAEHFGSARLAIVLN
jgi:hypothetical protein